MSSIHILTETGRIENIGSRIYKVLSPQVDQICQNELLKLYEHECLLQCGWVDIKVRYPEIHDQENANEGGYIIIPEFMIPGRPFPIYVYLYAITTYSLNPTMGQREAAKRTRERFGLKTFSHTTLGRAMKKLERRIEEYKGGKQDTEGSIENDEAEARTFPSVNQTKERREKVASYLKKASAGNIALTEEAIQPRKQPDYRKPPYTGAFIDACHSIVGYTFLNYHGFLL